MKKSHLILAVLLLMVVGYAAIQMKIDIKGNATLSENASDFNVYLANLKLNGTEIEGINETKDGYVINVPSKGTLEYDVVNDSTEYDVEATVECEEETGANEVTNFDYTGGEQTFVAPVTGVYKLETWGAQGGNIIVDNLNINGGYGSYSLGSVSLKQNNKLYLNIGGSGETTSLENTDVSGGYNGGGTSGYLSGIYETIWGSGGGATHIALKSGLLASLESSKESILIVSGSGGGSGYYIAKNKKAFIGGSGGGYIGNNGEGTTGGYGFGGTQIAGGLRNNRLNANGTFHGSGESGSFGVGGSFNKTMKCSGGGGGFYGGGSGHSEGSGAGGGSGYIGNPLLTNKTMYCYNCQESSEESTKTILTTCTSATPKENCSKQGNGYARITLIKGINVVTQLETTTIEAQDKMNKSVEVSNNRMKCSLKIKKLSRTEKKEKYSGPTKWTFDYTGGEQTFTVPVTGTYKLETWGAQGSSNWYGAGGYGGYSIGNINLNVNTELFINVGSKTGYNGGNYMSGVEAPGGGATHISTATGLLSNLENYKSNILMVSGGGGAGERENGGSGGGYIGGTGYALSNSYLYFGTGGTQSSGGSGVLSGKYTNNLYDINGSFGSGGIGYEKSDSGPNGGGGYYGGGATTLAGGAGGGSGYIGNSLLTNKSMYCYNCEESTEESTKTISTTCINETPTENCSKQGNGYARITLMSK